MPARLASVLVIVLLGASVIMMTVYAAEGPTGALHSFQAQMRTILSPFGVVSTAGGNVIQDAEVSMSDASADGEILSQLKQQNSELTEMLTQAEEYRLEIERLQELLNLKDEYDIDGITGRIVGRSTDAWNQTITLDVGSDDGIDAGLTVVGGGGVVGQVVSVTSGSCVVRLIVDPQSGVAAMVQSSRAEGIVRGSLAGLLYLEDVEAGVEVNIGDVVLTSGLGGSYTKGLLIGTVVRVEGNAADDSRRIIVAQNSNLQSMEEVLVVFSAKDGSGSQTPAVVEPRSSASSDSSSSSSSSSYSSAGEGDD